jgi:hypothetical protein
MGSQTKHKTEFASVASGASRGGFGGGWLPSGPKNRHWFSLLVALQNHRSGRLLSRPDGHASCSLLAPLFKNAPPFLVAAHGWQRLFPPGQGSGAPKSRRTRRA